jgi:hypothetical protein
MLQRIHDHSKGWLTWVIVVLICLAFSLWGVHSYTESGKANAAVATVNGTDISQHQLLANYERLRQQQQLRLGADYVLNAEAEKRLKEQVLHQLVDTEVLAQAAIAEGFRFTTQQEVATVHAIPTFQIKGQFSLTKFKETLDGMLYNEASFLADLRAAMLINQARVGLVNSAFALPGEVDTALKLVAQKRDISYAVLPVGRFIEAANVSEKAIQDYYQQHSNEFKTPEKVSVEYIELSLPDTKTDDKAERQFAEQSDQLANLTYADSTSLKSAAKKLNLPIKSTEMFENRPSKNGILANPKVVAAAYSAEVLTQGNNSNLIELNAHHVLVLRVKEHQASAVKPLAQVKSTIVLQLKKAAAKLQAQQLGDSITARLQSGTSVAQLTQQYHLAWEHRAGVGRYDSKVNAAILHEAFHLPRPASTRTPSLGGFVLPTGDYALVQVSAVRDGSSKTNSAERRIFQEQIEQAYGQLDYDRYVSGLFNAAKVEFKTTSGS